MDKDIKYGFRQGALLVAIGIVILIGIAVVQVEAGTCDCGADKRPCPTLACTWPDCEKAYKCCGCTGWGYSGTCPGPDCPPPPVCTPKTCSDLGKECGTNYGDSCGGYTGPCGNNGACTDPTKTCDSNGKCVAVTPPCAKNCTDLGKQCGTWDNGCNAGVNITCGNSGLCANSSQTCLSDGTCCISKTCTDLGKECGIWDNGCNAGVNITCGNSGACANSSTTCNSNGKCTPLITCTGSYLTMDGSAYSCCTGKNMCAVDPNGDSTRNVSDWYKVDWAVDLNPQDGPQCINAGEFLLDKLCGQGNKWGSRTGQLARIMQSKVDTGGGDYVLFCDEYKNSLNYYKQIIGTSQLDLSYLEKNGECGIYPCLGQFFCVLLDKTGNVKAVGGTLNPDTKGNLNNFTLLYSILNFTKNEANCKVDSSNSFTDCGAGLSYNSALGAFIYSRKGNSPSSMLGGIIDHLIALFNSLLGKYVTGRTGGDRVSLAIYNQISPDLNRLYAAKQGSKTVLAVEESLNKTQRLMAGYTGFKTNMCGGISLLINASKADCIIQGGTYYVFADRVIGADNSLFSSWPLITSSLRIQ